jgi:hypothetical protein
MVVFLPIKQELALNHIFSIGNAIYSRIEIKIPYSRAQPIFDLAMLSLFAVSTVRYFNSLKEARVLQEPKISDSDLLRTRLKSLVEAVEENHDLSSLVANILEWSTDLAKNSSNWESDEQTQENVLFLIENLRNVDFEKTIPIIQKCRFALGEDFSLKAVELLCQRAIPDSYKEKIIDMLKPSTDLLHKTRAVPKKTISLQIRYARLYHCLGEADEFNSCVNYCLNLGRFESNFAVDLEIAVLQGEKELKSFFKDFKASQKPSETAVHLGLIFDFFNTRKTRPKLAPQIEQIIEENLKELCRTTYLTELMEKIKSPERLKIEACEALLTLCQNAPHALKLTEDYTALKKEFVKKGTEAYGLFRHIFIKLVIESGEGDSIRETLEKNYENARVEAKQMYLPFIMLLKQEPFNEKKALDFIRDKTRCWNNKDKIEVFKSLCFFCSKNIQLAVAFEIMSLLYKTEIALTKEECLLANLCLSIYIKWNEHNLLQSAQLVTISQVQNASSAELRVDALLNCLSYVDQLKKDELTKESRNAWDGVFSSFLATIQKDWPAIQKNKNTLLNKLIKTYARWGKATEIESFIHDHLPNPSINRYLVIPAAVGVIWLLARRKIFVR